MRLTWIFSLVLALLSSGAELLAETRAEIRDRIFMTVQTAANSKAGKALAQSAGRIAAGSPDLAALLRERQDMSDRLEQEIAALADLGVVTGAAVEAEFARLKGEINASRARIAEIDATLLTGFPEFRDLTNPSPMSVAEVQAELRADEALIMTFTDAEFFYVWAVSKTDADWARVTIYSSEIEDQVRTLRSQLSGSEDLRAGVAIAGSAQPQVQPFDRAVAHNLYTSLLAPVERVFQPARHIMVVLDGPMAALPAAVLVTKPPTGDDSDPAALRTTSWMLRDHALTTLPSVSSLRVLRRISSAPPSTGREPFIGFGDPLLGYARSTEEPLLVAEADTGSGTIHSRGVYEDVAKVADLTPLPNTARELRRLAETMGAKPERLFLGRDATEANVKAADLSQASVIAFATHGLLAEGLPGLSEPALVFTPPDAPSDSDDALLTASEAAALKLSADLVILSACDTAGSDGTPGGEGLSGLARAFIYAGARAILVSHWPVDDYAASALTTGMLERMYGSEHQSRAQALQESALALLDDVENPRLSHPRIWAPFVVVGEGGL